MARRAGLREPSGSRLFFALLLAVLLATTAHAQSEPLPPPDTTAVRVATVAFDGNDFFSDQALRLRIRTAPNRRFLGVPGLTWWLWLYRAGASGRFGQRLGKALVASGEPPALLDTAVVRADAARLEQFYRQEGFRRAAVRAAIDTVESSMKATVRFAVEPGPPTYLRRVRYQGLDALEPALQLRLARGSLLRHGRIDPATPLTFEARRQRYSELLLHEERRRVLALLRSSGFAVVARDSVRAYVTPHRPDSFDVTLRANPGPRFRFGAIQFEVSGPEADRRPRRDTLGGALTSDLAISWQIEHDRQIDPDLLVRALQFRPGEWYDERKVLATKRRLEATGIFTFTDIVALLADSVTTGPYDAPLLPHRIAVRTRDRHQIRFETFMVQRSGLLGGAENELGTGLGVSYENANLFGSGESFRLSTTGSLAADVDSTLFTSAQAEVATSLTLPYLLAPLRPLDRWLDLYQARTRLSLSLVTARRDDLRLLIRGRGAMRTRFELQHAPTVTSFLDLLDVSLSNPDTLRGFQELFLDRLLIDDSLDVTGRVQQEQILQDYTQPQINNALRYTLRTARVNPLRRERGYSYEAAFEIGGNLPFWLDRFVFSPDSVEGTLPGLPFFSGRGSRSRLVYRQYIRFVTDLRRYQPLGQRTVFAWKLIGGLALPTGRADVVPFDRRFYSGGASSVRGWRLRELGPGAASFAAADGTSNILGGDVKLEAAAELRSTLLRNVFAADWIVAFFADAGNVWFGPRNPGFGEGATGPDGRFALDQFYKEIGVGSGFGLRLAWEYLIVRFDLGYRLYDPARTGDGLLPDGLRDPTPYFGIGHAF